MDNMEPIDSAPPAGDAGSGAIKPPEGCGAKEIRNAGLMQTSDAEAWAQLVFHLACIAACSSVVAWSYWQGWWGLFFIAEVLDGVCISFLFNAFHEMVHNTAFHTPQLNTVGAHILGFLTFRGAKWFWCFHWKHHRFTNDPELDPELSGASIDLDDPTASLSAYFSFLSGYPFGFERVLSMWRRATSGLEEPWVQDKSEATRHHVKLEARAYCAGYGILVLAAICRPFTLGKALFLYWLLPHCLGAGHLRMYQFAEHRACTMGKYTDTNAWVCARTTITWWFYRKLAWQMPWHIEHHAFPNVPFHKLEQAYEMVRAAYEKQGVEVPSGCTPNGSRGYTGLHTEAFQRMLKNVSANKAAKAA